MPVRRSWAKGLTIRTHQLGLKNIKKIRLLLDYLKRAGPSEQGIGRIKTAPVFGIKYLKIVTFDMATRIRWTSGDS
jgi:hypothetical protein